MPDACVTSFRQGARWASAQGQGVLIGSLKSLALPILWMLFVAVTGWGTVSNGIAWLWSGPAVAWTAQFFGLAVRNPFAWLNGRRLVFASIAFGMMLGRLITGSLFGYLGYVPLDGLMLFLLTPVALLIAGIRENEHYYIEPRSWPSGWPDDPPNRPLAFGVTIAIWCRTSTRVIGIAVHRVRWQRVLDIFWPGPFSHLSLHNGISAFGSDLD